jgi:catechol 2,3-dioxygenase-like lactoylglutathione lyase family enzyme
MLTPPRPSPPGSQGVAAAPRMVYLIVYVSDLADSRAFYEGRLGLNVIEEDDHSVKLSAGLTILLLNRAGDHGIELPGRPNESAGMVFLVDDLRGACRALERRGVAFAGQQVDVGGAVADCFDPNGHRILLYAPSRRTREIEDRGSRIEDRGRRVCRSSILDPRSSILGGLKGAALCCFFVSAAGAEQARAFYGATLGLPVLELSHLGRLVPPGGEEVVEFDTGGVVLLTHSPPAGGTARQDLTSTRGLGPVLHTPDMGALVEQLSRKGVVIPKGVGGGRVGKIAGLTAPSGHPLYFYEPSEEALGWPSGLLIQQILAARV